MVKSNDEAVQIGLEWQVLEPESRYYGGVIDASTGVAWVNHTTGTPTDMCNWGTALVNPDSAYYRDEELAKRLTLASEFVLRMQHEDGSISPGWTNYHSPPDTAFVVVGYYQLYKLLNRAEWKPLEPTLRNMRLFLERTLPVMLTGGCHTPNHRWVLCAALGCLRELLGGEAGEQAARRADQWLAEGMDITPDGEWTERSNGIYSAVSDIMLIYAARLLERPELLEPVRLNLRMMVYLVHPSGEVVTDYSGRQDLGKFHDLSAYYLPYAMMARQDDDPLFAGMASLAIGAMEDAGPASVNALIQMLLAPELRGPWEAEAQAAVPTRYEKMLNGEFRRENYLAGMEQVGHHGRIFHSRMHTDFGAPVARIREGTTSVTLMTETPSFFALRHGAARLLAVQVASYFYPGYVPMQTMEREANGTYRLSGEQRKGYYGPVAAPNPPIPFGEVSPWYLLPHQERELTHEQVFRAEIEAVPVEGGWDLHIHAHEPGEVMTQLSFVFGGEGQIVSGEGGHPGEDKRFWSGGTLRYENGADWIELTGGELAHVALSVREANLPEGCKVALVNLMTPFDKTVRIRMSPAVPV